MRIDFSTLSQVCSSRYFVTWHRYFFIAWWISNGWALINNFTGNILKFPLNIFITLVAFDFLNCYLHFWFLSKGELHYLKEMLFSEGSTLEKVVNFSQLSRSPIPFLKLTMAVFSNKKYTDLT